MRRERALCAFGFLAAMLLLAGCGRDGMSEVSGTVTVDGKAAETGAISFIPADGKAPTTGTEINGGRYTAKVPVGMAKVQIRVSKVIGKKKLYDTPESPYQDILKEVLPAKFNDETELTLDVKPGKNPKDWDLKSK
jgi:hypothetical protein